MRYSYHNESTEGLLLGAVSKLEADSLQGEIEKLLRDIIDEGDADAFEIDRHPQLAIGL